MRTQRRRWFIRTGPPRKNKRPSRPDTKSRPLRGRKASEFEVVLWLIHSFDHPRVQALLDLLRASAPGGFRVFRDKRLGGAPRRIGLRHAEDLILIHLGGFNEVVFRTYVRPAERTEAPDVDGRVGS